MLWDSIELPSPNGWIEILCLAVIFYYVFYFLRGTRGAPVLFGLLLLFVALAVLTRLFHLDELNWLLGRISVYLAVALIIIFQPEIRRALAEIGKQHFFGGTEADQTLVDAIVQSAVLLSRRRFGALIAIERDIGTRTVQETGIALDSLVTPELLASIFFHHTPLHDGGVVICGARIVAARCMFPPSQHGAVSKALGTRHRAALGLSEETDAVVVVVSEETGAMSIGHQGKLIQNMDEEQLRRYLSGVLVRPRAAQGSWLRRWTNGKQRQ